MTSWKQWIHFRRSDFWPPTSIITSRFLDGPAIVKCISWIPIVRARAKMMSYEESGGGANRVLISGNWVAWEAENGRVYDTRGRNAHPSKGYRLD